MLQARLTALTPGPVELVLGVGFAYGVVAAVAHLAALTRPRLRPTWFRLGVSLPGMAFVGSGGLATLWLGALAPVRIALGLAGAERALAALAWFDLLPIVVTVLSIPTSLGARPEVVRIALANDGPDEVTRVPVARHRPGRAPAAAPGERPLRIVQITDPHLGPWKSIDELARQIDELLAQFDDEEAIEDVEPGELPATPVTRTGDLWVLGGHRRQ